jgi:hypothetical protein
MKQILTIGHQHFVLPATANLNLLLKTLSSAREVEKRWHESTTYWDLLTRECAFKVELVKDSAVIDPASRKRIPEQTGGPY